MAARACDPALVAVQFPHDPDRVEILKRAAIIMSRFAFEPAEAVELVIGRFEHAIAGRGAAWFCSIGATSSGVTRTTSSVSVVLIESLLKIWPTIGKSPKIGIRDVWPFVVVWIRPAMASVCPSRSSTIVCRTALVDRRDRSAVDGRAAGEIELAERRLDVQADSVVGQDVRQEGQIRAEILELDRHDRRAAGNRRALRHRERELTAGEESRGLAVEGEEVRLGEDLRQVVLPQGVDEERKLARVEHAEEARIPRARPPIDVPTLPIALT